MDYSFAALPETLHGLLDAKAAEHSERCYALVGGESLSYGALAEASRRAAAGLSALGIAAGDRVVVMASPTADYLALWFGLSRIGAVETPINPAYKGSLLDQLIETAAPAACVLEEGFRVQVMEASAERLAGCPVLTPSQLCRAPSSVAEARRVSPRQVASIIFTSGTTGRSKGVMMRQSHELSFGLAFAEITGLTAEDTTYNFLPFFHIAAKFVALGTLLRGGRMLLVDRFSVSQFWDDVRANGVTVSAAVGGLCHMLYSQERRPVDAENPLRLIYAVPVPWEFKADFERRFGLALVEGYGGTESNLVAYTRLGEPTPRGSLGRSSPHFEIQIQDELGRACPPGETGEICVRARHPGTMMSGYFNEPEKSLEALAEGWFHSGDIGRMQEDGYLFFIDRLKDAIRRRGENISTFEVERVLNGHPDIAESAVIPYPSALGEDDVKAVVVLRKGVETSCQDLFLFANEQLPYFMVPRFIEVRDHLPRTPTMKIRKTELREQGNGAGTWDCEAAGWRISGKGLRKLESHG